VKIRPLVAMSASVAVAALVVAAAPTSAVAPLRLSINAGKARHAISPYIYGMNYASDVSGLTAAVHVPVNRWGGNATTLYNYLNNTYNTGSDYYFENIVATGNQTLHSFVAANKKAKIASIVTVPMSGWVAKDSPSNHPFTCSFPVNVLGAQQYTDQWDPNCGNGVTPSLTNLTADPTTTSIAAGPAWDTSMVQSLVAAFGTAAHGGVGIYQLDNEPDIWDYTHRDVHPAAPTYAELASRAIATATAVKQADPTAKVLGPSFVVLRLHRLVRACMSDGYGSLHLRRLRPVVPAAVARRISDRAYPTARLLR
jgi:hypothetical protein